jgi:vacuolar-type H+-ATPase subunit E/Vma4
MLKAIKYFEELKSDDYLFAISKCNLKYVRIVLEEEEEGITSETKNTLMEILEKTDKTCEKKGNWLQQTICKILQSKVLMAGDHSQADRDKAN